MGKTRLVRTSGPIEREMEMSWTSETGWASVMSVLVMLMRGVMSTLKKAAGERGRRWRSGTAERRLACRRLYTSSVGGGEKLEKAVDNEKLGSGGVCASMGCIV